MTSFPGWTWEYVDEHMTLPRYFALGEYWEQWPPLHKLVSVYMGHKPKAKATSNADVAAFMAASQMANFTGA